MISLVALFCTFWIVSISPFLYQQTIGTCRVEGTRHEPVDLGMLVLIHIWLCTPAQQPWRHSLGQTKPVKHVLFCSLAVLNTRVCHTMNVLSLFISLLCHSDWLFHGESCPFLDVVHPGCAWPSSPACTWLCSLHYLLLQATPLFPHGVTRVC